MGAKCAPESAAYEKVMQINTVRCSDPLSEKSPANGVANLQHVRESKGKLPGSSPPVTKVQTPTAKSTEAAVPAVTPTTAETRSLPGKVSHSRKQSLGSNSLKTNGSAKNGDSLSSFRSTSTMSSGSIASNISQLCEKYFMQPLIRSRSLPTNVGTGSNGSSNNRSRTIPYIHLRRRKGKCMRTFCMRFLPPAAACSGAVAWELNIIANRRLGKTEPGDGTKPVFPLGFSKGNPGLPQKEVVKVGNVNTDKLQELRESVKPVEQPTYNFFICHTEEDYEPYVKKLVKKCEKEDISIFTRSYSLLWGDSQRQDTEYAIASATYGIVLLSPSLLNSYRNTWCEKDLDVLFDRNTSNTGNTTHILPIYCGQITHKSVQEKYPFLAIQKRLVYEEEKVEGIVRQMKQVLEKRKMKLKQFPTTRTIIESEAQPEPSLKTVSELEVECEMKNNEVGLVCTRPTSLSIQSDQQQPSNSSSLNTASTPTKLSGVLKSSGVSSKVKKTLRINPDPKVHKTEPMYPNDGVINHCCHCGPMSSKYRGASAFSQSDLDSEAQLMEQLHQTRIAEDNDNCNGEEEEEEEEEDKVLKDPAKLNDLLPMLLSTLRYDVLRQLCFMMDPLVTVGSDFTTFAAQIGFCSTYIRYLKALDIKKNSPFEEVLRVWQDSAPDATIGDLMYLLNEIQRHDVVDKLREFYLI